MDRISSKSILTNIVQEYSDFSYSCNESYNLCSKKTYLYLLVNKSLKLSPGKVASQVGHAVEKIYKHCHKYQIYKSYLNTGSPKIVLSVPNEEQFVEILDQTKNIFKVYVIDEGLTQCPKNSVTVVGFEPLLESKAPLIFKKLSLY